MQPFYFLPPRTSTRAQDMSDGDPKEEEIEPPPDTDPEGEVVEEVDESELAVSVSAPPVGSGTTICPGCQASTPEADACLHCGAPLFLPKFCIGCGEERRQGAHFCHGCGASF